MHRVRGRQNDRSDRGIGEHRFETADELEPMLGRIIAKLSGIAAYRMGKSQYFALTLNRLDKGLAPAAEADDRGVDHRPARRLLRARSAKVPVEEIEHLVPAVDRLLRAIIRAIPREEGMTGAVVTVELVVLSVTL